MSDAEGNFMDWIVADFGILAGVAYLLPPI